MDLPDFPAAAKSPSPRSLQGPRPTPLRVRKDSHKIRKPPVAPPPQHQQHNHHHPQQIQQPYRPPIIIYTVSPKVIHTNPTEFMNLVQRLTGPSASSPVGSSFSPFHHDGGAVSPAARFASLEKAATVPDGRKVPLTGDVAVVEGVEISTGMEKQGYFPGILSPGPASLPPIPPGFFSPLTNDQNPLSFFPYLSPVLHSSRNYNYLENNNFLMQSPSTLLSPFMVSPNTQNLFNSLFD